MGPFEDAKAHLVKAQQFLKAAEVNLELDLFDAATSNAVSCGINAKDAICLKLTGRTSKTERHKDGVKELRAAGAKAAVLASKFDRLLSLKKKAQYQTAAATRTEAVRSVDWARCMYDGAQEIVTS